MMKPVHGRFLGLALALAIAPGGGAAAGTAVVELFTSQGCSSCPPADALLGAIADEPGVIALSLHVDYWDGLGWTDPFGSALHTERQRAYAAALDDGNAYTSGVYTPQMVIDGRHAVVGHAADRVRAAIAAAVGRADSVVPRFDGPDRVVVPDGEGDDDAVVWAAHYDQRRITEVERGENGGRTLVNHRVVRSLQRLGEWHGRRTGFAIDAAAARANGRDGVVIVVQRAGTGRIIGAADHSLGE